jgi:hypothetical protein
VDVAPTTRDRRTLDERTLTCPRDGRRKSIRDCLAFEQGGCTSLLPYMGCREVGVFGRQRRAGDHGNLFGEGE